MSAAQNASAREIIRDRIEEVLFFTLIEGRKVGFVSGNVRLARMAKRRASVIIQ
jgi:hypothetical protein